MMHLSRRTALLGLTTAWTLGRTSFALADAPTEKRLVVVILRGALDGMAAVVPYGDPDLARLRGGLIPPEPGQPGGLLDLGGFYGLHPALEGMHDMYKAGQLLPVHAVAGPYRSRSHFDAQDYLESGADQRLSSGWLNRAVEAMPGHKANTALSVGVTVPLMLRGAAPVGTYAPTGYQPLAPELYARIADLAHDDALLGPVIVEGLKDRGFAHETLMGLQQNGDKNAVANVAQAAGKLLANADGPRVAVVEAGGWDTHAGQLQRLVAPLKQLDVGLAALKQSMGPAWKDTAVLVMTEFGRTARMNGTNGTDHGTAGVAFIAGGAIEGGKVAGTWPGLKDAQLFENRDLAPTGDLRSLAIALLVRHLGVPASAMPKVFPGSGGVAALGGILRA
jgi:uncharacterized protein (DUF1501 family)